MRTLHTYKAIKPLQDIVLQKKEEEQKHIEKAIKTPKDAAGFHVYQNLKQFRLSVKGEHSAA